jgi:hypothetical protein
VFLDASLFGTRIASGATTVAVDGAARRPMVWRDA